MTNRYFAPLVIGVLLVIIASLSGVHIDIYDRVPHFDKLLHLTGGAIAAWLVILFFGSILPSVSLLKRWVIVLGGVCLIGLAWEWLEFAVGEFSLRYAEWFYPYFHIGTLTDTLGDFAADLLGAAAVIFTSNQRR